MIWSISKYRGFVKCPKKWFFDEKFASDGNNGALRKEAFYLSQLNSIDGWKGNIVDFSIENYIIPLIKERKKINVSDIINKTRKLTRDRYDFAREKRYRTEGLKKSDHVYDYAALYCFEYPCEFNLTEKFTETWEQIEIALTNFLNKNDLIDYLSDAEYLVAQRGLSYRKHEVSVKGVPDLIAFFKDKPPHIFDWKAHYTGTKNYSQQLIVYAIALERCDAHSDFPGGYKNFKARDYKITEFQLITNTYRDHTIEDEYIEEVEDYIAEGIYTMLKQGCDLEYKKLNIKNFGTTRDPRDCEKCSFKNICWGEQL